MTKCGYMHILIKSLTKSKCLTIFMLITSNILEIFLALALEGIAFIYKVRPSAHFLILQLLHCYVHVSLFCSMTNSFKGAVCPPGRDS